jgi:putative AbiEi antitoxin of type IV toxin-antitoxin system
MRMPVDLPKSLDGLLPLQANVVSREQALTRGKSRHDIAGLLKSGRWRRVHPGVYYTLTGPVPRRAVLWAAVLKVGRGAVLSHETAAEVWEITDEQSSLIHLSVPRMAGSPVVPPRVRLHHSTRLPEAEFPAAIAYKMPPVTWADEAVLDLVHCAGNAEDAVAWAIKACQRGKSDPDLIRMRLLKPGRSRLQWRDDLLSALADIQAGVQSPLESRYLHDVEQAHDLPEGKRQVKTKHGSRVQFHDVRYVDYGVAIELDGVRWHSGETRYLDDARDNRSALDGFRTLRYGWLKVAYHPCEVAHEVWSLLVKQGYRRDFHACGTGCALQLGAPVTVSAVERR